MVSLALQKHVESGQWVVGEIAGHLLKQLKQNQPAIHSDPGLTSRCLAHYRRLQLASVGLNSSSQGLRDLQISEDARSAINEIFKKELEQAQVGNGFTHNESEKIELALNLIKSFDPLVNSLLSKIVTVFLKAENVHFRSASHPHLMGAIILSEKVVDQTIEGIAISIIHELAHQELYCLNLLDRLVVKSFDYNEIHAPFQGRKRPPIGRLHSMWALYRMVQFENKLGVSSEKHAGLLRKNCKAFESQELTDFGNFLVSVTAKQVA